MRAVGEDDEDEVETEDSYDEDENDDNETESDFGDEDMDDVEWNSRVTAMTGGSDWRCRTDDRSGGSSRPTRQQLDKVVSKRTKLTTALTESSDDLDIASLPAIFKTPDGACAVDIPLSGVRSAAALIDAIVHLGSAMVDADISESTIKVHYATAPGERPRKLTRTTRFDAIRKATGIIVTPGGQAQK